MNLEVREDQTDYEFRFENIANDLPVGITVATYRILGPAGNVYVGSTAMNIDSNVASTIINFAVDPTSLTYSRGRNYRIEMTIDGRIINQFFDIVRYPFQNLVTDQDLINENDILLNGISESTGKANSIGNTDPAILIDSNRVEANAYWQGGVIRIFPSDDTDPITEHQVTNFVKAGGIIYYDPPRSTAPTTERYSIRRSYQKLIDSAGERVREKISIQNNAAYLLIDSTQVNRLIILETIAHWFQVKRKAEGDEYDIQFKYYRDEYDKLFNAIPLMFDVDDSGTIDATEQRSNFTTISLVR